MELKAKTRRDEALTGLERAHELAELYGPLDGLDLTPGWIDRDVPILWNEPHSAFPPVHWRYSECKTALDAAGRLIGTELAERHNLVLRNPIEGNNFATTKPLLTPIR